MKNVAFIFPGQGTQSSGMGLDLYNNFEVSKKVFQKADEVLKKGVSAMCFEGSDDELKQTSNAQSAILAVSISALEALKSELNLEPKFVAGHSLGEYAAYYGAGVLDLDNVFLAIQKRSDLMQKATLEEKGAMSAVLGLSTEIIKENLQEGVSIANYNEPNQTVITGLFNAVEKTNEILKEKGAKRVISLAVSGAFHSTLMKSATDEFKNFVNTLTIADAKIPVITNVDAEITIRAEEFKEKMPRQISSSVYWAQTIQKMLEKEVDTFVEIGPGKVLAGLNRKICPEIKTYNVYDTNSLKETIEGLK